MLFRIIIILALLPNMVLAQHTIKGVFTPAKDYEVVLLYRVTPTVSEYITNAPIQKDGSFHFDMDASAVTGMYRLVYAVPQEDYNFDVIYNGKEDIILAFNSETGVTFKASVENKLLASYTASMSAITQSITNYFRSERKDTIALNSIFKTQRDAQTRYEKLAEKTIALHFIKANKPYIPKKYENVKTYVKNLKIHYFDNIDFANKILQSSSFLQERMLNYVFGVSNDEKDEITNYKSNIDVFANALKAAPTSVKRILLLDLWQEMVDLNLAPVANHISKNYLLEVAKLLKDDELVSTLTLYTNLSIGHKAPDFSFTDNKTKTTRKLSELTEAERYIIVFWSSSCSHCLDEIPQLHNFMKTKAKNKYKVIAIGLEDDDKKWKEQIKNYPDFTHVLGLGKWENKIGDAYGVNATPTYFILDKDKKMLYKPEDIEELKEFVSLK
ncbi:TlpA family protein disulfide reductase [Mariniflexile sp.]|uniref:TlpA family protein disulfide reductase n=1 Tax=Mariniflexile sp. TaxID=1979402 RepID=UPI0035636B3C